MVNSNCDWLVFAALSQWALYLYHHLKLLSLKSLPAVELVCVLIWHISLFCWLSINRLIAASQVLLVCFSVFLFSVFSSRSFLTKDIKPYKRWDCSIEECLNSKITETGFWFTKKMELFCLSLHFLTFSFTRWGKCPLCPARIYQVWDGSCCPFILDTLKL